MEQQVEKNELVLDDKGSLVLSKQGKISFCHKVGVAYFSETKLDALGQPVASMVSAKQSCGNDCSAFKIGRDEKGVYVNLMCCTLPIGYRITQPETEKTPEQPTPLKPVE